MIEQAQRCLKRDRPTDLTQTEKGDYYGPRLTKLRANIWENFRIMVDRSWLFQRFFQTKVHNSKQCQIDCLKKYFIRCIYTLQVLKIFLITSLP